MRYCMVVLLLLMAGCGTIATAEREAVYGPAVYAGDDWTIKALDIAADFWYAQDFLFDIGTPGGIEIVVNDLTPYKDRVGQCRSGYIDIDPRMEKRPADAAAVIAHELGHFLGMDHVGPDEDGDGAVDETVTHNLMSPIVTTDASGYIWWGDLDEQEWDRTGHGAKKGCP